MGTLLTDDSAGIDRDPLADPRTRGSLLTAVIDNAPFGAHMYRLDDDQRLVFIGYNRKAEQMLGIEHDALIGLTLEEAFPGNVGTDTPAAYKRVAREGGVWDVDQYAYDASGIAGVFEVHAFWFGPRRVSVFFRDVTEKRKAELALLEANEMLAVAQRAGGAGFWSWDVPTGKLTWTSGFLDLFGLPADAEASFEAWRAALHPDDAQAAEARIMSALSDRVPLENEYRVVLPDGRVRWIAATGTTTYDDDGAPLRMAGICIDIDDRKRREQEIHTLNEQLEQRVAERTRELSVTNRELQEFVYSVSHDLRSPLRALDGFSMVLLEDYADVLDEEGRGHLERVRAAAQHMAELIDALLALSRVGRRDVDVRFVDLTATARSIVGELSEAEPERNVSVSVDDELHAHTDEALADIVLRNLLGNAWKFTSHREAASIVVGSMRKKGATVFYVRDDGAGFDPAHAGAMFRPFQRLHDQAEFPGTGIGLATVKRALDKLHGSCWAEGAPGEGATFFFTLG
jgi:PAS domain S-box-containing protein